MKAADCRLPFRVMVAMQIVNSRYSDPHLNLDLVAQGVRISPCHLSRLLKKVTGRGFASHLRYKRASAARALLLTTTVTIKEAASAVGYSDTDALSRNFRRVYQLTPSAFLRRELDAVRRPQLVPDCADSSHDRIAYCRR